VVAAVTALVAGPGAGASLAAPPVQTSTPIKHLVVIFGENVSFDHYFGTYPDAAGTDGQSFVPAAGTPSVNGLTGTLLTANPNGVNPQRYSPSQIGDVLTCDQDHNYTDEQKAFDAGAMDKFVETVGRGAGACADYGTGKGLVMGYYDGNTVTGLWNYAQHFAMSDNSYASTFGPSTPGALNLISGQTHGFTTDGTAVPASSSTVIGDPQPTGDKCDNRDTSSTVPGSTNKNVGDLLNAKGVSWGWFQGGFADCTASHTDIGGVSSKDYIPHHEPFQYYPSTANLQHTPPASVAEIGHAGPANHQYDLSSFWSAVNAGTMPAVSYLKAAAYQDGHAGYSTPLDEQRFLLDTVNRLQQTPDWKNTAVVVAYDDSDGWYDHQMSPIVNQSQDPTDALTAPGQCGANPARVAGGYQDRCGYGPRQPLLVISPFAKSNFVDHTVTDQSSILKFVEDNWNTGRIGDSSFDAKAGSLDNLFAFDGGHRAAGHLVLDPSTGQPTS
jgi:phospholipase C